MKNSVPFFTLGVILFLWACSAAQEDEPLINPIIPVIIDPINPTNDNPVDPTNSDPTNVIVDPVNPTNGNPTNDNSTNDNSTNTDPTTNVTVTNTPPPVDPIIEANFLEKVKGKVAYAHPTLQNETTKLGTFSANGRAFVSLGLLGSADEITLEKVIDVNTVTYTFIDINDNDKLYIFTMFTPDGITGTVTGETGDADDGIVTSPAWLVTPLN